LPWGAGRSFAQHFELKRQRRQDKGVLATIWFYSLVLTN
jgi:hypothetical protein